jgi:glucoamylase
LIQDTLLATPQDSLYRWLDQQGEAFGAPGMEPRWTSSVKDAVGTAYSASSRIWFTVSHGILNEIYHPTIDHPQTRDMELLITDGTSFVHEEKRDLAISFEYIHSDALGVRYINRDREAAIASSKKSSAIPTTASSSCTSASKPVPTAAKNS